MEERRDIPTADIPAVSDEKEPSSLRLILTLGLAGFAAGIVMAGAYLLTKPVIDANKAAAVEKAIYQVLPGISSFKTLELKNGKLLAYEPKAGKQASKDDAPKLVYMGFDKNNRISGFAMPGSEIGFADVITVMIGYDPGKRTVIGFRVLECKETPGLGDKIFKDADFQQNFTALLTDPEILFAKKGEKHRPNEVEAITGATISSKAVIRLLNNSMNEWKEPIADYLKSEQTSSSNKTP